MVRGRCAKSTGPTVYKIKYWNTMWYKVEISCRCFLNAKKRVVNSVRWNNRGPKVSLCRQIHTWNMSTSYFLALTKYLNLTETCFPNLYTENNIGFVNVWFDIVCNPCILNLVHLSLYLLPYFCAFFHNQPSRNWCLTNDSQTLICWVISWISC